MNKLQRKCKHKRFELIEKKSKFGYRCLDCGLRTILADTQNWAYFHFINKHTNKVKLIKALKNQLRNLWRGCVLKRFEYKCVVCSQTKLPNCHHIIPEHVFVSMRYDVDNGVILCPSHHKFGKLSAHKNALWFCDLVLKKIMNIDDMNALINRMLNNNSDKFIWTIEKYYKKIQELEALMRDNEKITE